MFYEIMHRESCVAQLSTTGECRVCLEDFMPYDLVLVESDDFDERINNVTNFYYWCASRMLTLDRTYAKEILNSIGASQSVTDPFPLVKDIVGYLKMCHSILPIKR